MSLEIVNLTCGYRCRGRRSAKGAGIVRGAERAGRSRVAAEHASGFRASSTGLAGSARLSAAGRPKARAVVEGFSAVVEPGDVFCLMGPNGVGKTTLFRTVLGFLPRLSGEVRIDGRDAASYTDRERAKLVAYVPQAHTPPFAFAVRDVVVMGQVSARSLLDAPRAADYEAAGRLLSDLGIGHLSDRIYTELSGGERQMVLIARALAQRPRYLMMDEPTAALDYGNESQVLSLVKRLAASGLGIVMTTHTPEHVAQCEGRGALLLRDGSCVCGTASDILSPDALRRAYGVEVMVSDVRYAGKLRRVCQPLVD